MVALNEFWLRSTADSAKLIAKCECRCSFALLFSSLSALLKFERLPPSSVLRMMYGFWCGNVLQIMGVVLLPSIESKMFSILVFASLLVVT